MGRGGSEKEMVVGGREREEWKIVGFILHSARDYERNRHETW